MKPFHAGKTIANWLLRLALLAILCVLYFNIVSTWNFRNWSYLIAISALFLGILNLVGGLFSMPGITVVSGLIISILSIYKLIVSFNGIFDQYFALHLVPLALGFYFFVYGND
jgi:hypothetical protein